MVPALIFVVVVVAVGVGAYLSYVAKRRRLQAFGALALQLGLTYAAEDPFGMLGEPFKLFEKGEGRGIENVLYGAYQGLDVRAFDYWYYTETSDSKGNRSRSYSRFDCAMLPLEAACSPLTIEHETVLTRLADHLAMHDIEFESEEFNKAFNVKSPDKKFANDFIDARMEQWLLKNGSGLSFEIVADRLLCVSGQIEPAELSSLLTTAKGFHDTVPSVVADLYPKRPDE
jgi:hypothetical protein